MRTLFALQTTLLIVILASAVAAHEAKPPELKLAAAFQLPQLPGLSGPSADWRQWDSFFRVRRQTIRSRVERRLERFIGGCVSRFPLRTDIGDCVHGGTESRARAFFKWLEAIITSPQQGS